MSCIFEGKGRQVTPIMKMNEQKIEEQAQRTDGGRGRKHTDTQNTIMEN